jgi:hypothetical protein
MFSAGFICNVVIFDDAGDVDEIAVLECKGDVCVDMRLHDTSVNFLINVLDAVVSVEGIGDSGEIGDSTIKRALFFCPLVKVHDLDNLADSLDLIEEF